MAATKAQRGSRRGNPKSGKAKASEMLNIPKGINKKTKRKKSNPAVIAKESIVIQKRNRKKLRVEKLGVVYLSHIPHGFYEPQMREYFAQFGSVKRVVLRRSNKTGRSRGYAFIEFYNNEVAKIAAETMNNYLMFERLLKCKFIPPEEIPDNRKELFYNVKIDSIKKQGLEKKRAYNAPKSTSKVAKLVSRKKTKAEKLSKILAERGIDFSFEVPKTTSPSDQEPTNLQQPSLKASGKKKAKKPKPSSPTQTGSSLLLVKTPQQDSKGSKKRRRKKKVAKKAGVGL